MIDSILVDYVLPLADPRANLAVAGGKGASLACLVQAGLPVPAGFHVTTEAYRQFVAENGLQMRILQALEPVAATDPASLNTASQAIERLFLAGQMPDAVAATVLAAYSRLPGDEPAVAVRSSATTEDLPELSFAGQQETYLNICGGDAVLAAIQRCWASLWTARAIGYRAQNNIDPATVALAVVVQMLVPAEAAGILFTANPLNGQRDQMVVNTTWGLGEAIVGGLVNPDTLVVDRSSGKLIARETSEKTLMTVPTDTGAIEQPVPAALRHAPVLDDTAALELTAAWARGSKPCMACRWISSGRAPKVSLPFSRRDPITTLPAQAPATEEWNDSLTGDYLWTSTNLGEAVPDVMTPCTWSLVQIFIADTMPVPAIDGHRLIGNIGGRFYMNLSVLATLAAAFGLSHKRFAEANEQAFGRLPAGLEIPLVPVSRWRVLRTMLPIALRLRRRVSAESEEDARLPRVGADTLRRAARPDSGHI